MITINTTDYNILNKDIEGFKNLSTLLHKYAGVFLPLSEKNLSLMAGRLAKILNKYSCQNYADFINILNNTNNNALGDFISTMTTHTTHFFREIQHFTFLENNLASICDYVVSQNEENLRIWCSAASTGEEVWTIAIVCEEFFSKNKPKLNYKILGTDIDQNSLHKANKAIYKYNDIKNLPPNILQKYFSKTNEDLVNINNILKPHVSFAEFNLLNKQYNFKKFFDIIFCRNVLIYFDKDETENTITKFIDCLNNNAYLILGHAEAIVHNKHKLKKNIPAVYQKTNS